LSGWLIFSTRPFGAARFGKVHNPASTSIA
jgi:hypothetical protein